MRKKIIAKYFDRSKKLHVNNKDYVNQFMTLFQWFLDADKVKDDVSTKLILGDSPAKQIKAKIISNEQGILAGIEETIFFLKNKSKIKIVDFKKDGAHINTKDIILIITGGSSDILAYERTILNILARMSGIATQTYRLSKGVTLAATRKTPWMWLDKKAVAVGGGLTHRLSLADGILIKDNHLNLISKSRMNSLKINNSGIPFEIEVESYDEAISQVEAYLDKKIINFPIIMLDNFSPAQAAKTIRALKIIEKKSQKPIIIELSGGISEKNLASYSRVGADVISMGFLTHSATALNLSLLIENL